MAKNLGIGFLVLLLLFILSFASTSIALGVSKKEDEGGLTENGNSENNQDDEKLGKDTLLEVLREAVQDVKNHPEINGARWILFKATPIGIEIGRLGGELQIDFLKNGRKKGTEILDLFFSELKKAFPEPNSLIVVGLQEAQSSTDLENIANSQVLSDTITNSGFLQGYLDTEITENDPRFQALISFK